MKEGSRRLIVFLCLFILRFTAICGQNVAITDSILLLQEVEVTGRSQNTNARSTTSVQILSENDLRQLPAIQLSDAAKFFSGVTIKDYGGIGGLKTISIRSLGANHTAIGYDGIALSDYQTGQIDLGRFSLDNLQSISLSAGQSDDIFQTARLFASAGVLNIKTKKPQFTSGQQTKTNASLKLGSFGLFNPHLVLENKWSKRFSSSVSVDWLQSKGNYPYTIYYGEGGFSEQKERKNSDVKDLRLETSIRGKTNEQNDLNFKLYYYQSQRGLPGATIYNYDYVSQRLEDKNFFMQGHYKHRFSSKISWQLNAKFNWTNQYYLDPDYLGSQGKMESNYYQREYYLSSTLLYRVCQDLSVSLATDASINNMNADLPSFAYPQRISGLSVLAGKYITERFSLIGTILATTIHEQVNYREHDYQDANYGKKAGNKQRLSPSLSLSIQPFEQENMRLRLMYKEIFRMPTFNDLYYSRVGNTKLQPEYTWQYNAGITWQKALLSWFPLLGMTADFYYNKIKDKIVAVPKKNLFEWSMQNLGKVDIYGMDITLNTHLCLTKAWEVNLSGTYTRQKAWDVTSKTDPIKKVVYKHQIPYTPEQSGSGRIQITIPWINVSYSLLYSDYRYVLGENIPENYLKGYIEHSISLSKEMKWNKIDWGIRGEVLNLSDKQYEVVKSFPMPGRSFRITLNIKR